MKYIKALGYVYLKSLTSLDYYKELKDSKNKFSFKYFFGIALAASIITTTFVGIRLVPELKDGFNSLITELSSIYPEELVFEIKDGEWFINQPEPYAIKAPGSAAEDPEIDFPTNLLVFAHEGTVNDLEELDTLLLLNDVNLISRQENGRLEVYPLQDLPDTRFDKQRYEDNISKLASLSEYITVLFVLIGITGAFFYYFLYRLAYLTFVALALLLVGALSNTKIDFDYSYKIALHTFTLPLTLEVLMTVVNANVPFGFWIILSNLIFGILVVKTLKKDNL